jgi:hypothetical protein
MKSHIAILFLAAFVFGSCTPNSTSINSSATTTPGHTVILTIGGVIDTFRTQPVVYVSPTATILGSHNGDSIGFSLVNISSPGHYDIGTVFSASSSGVVMNYISSNPSTIYSSATTSGTPNGIMTVTQISSDSVQATFHDTLYLVSGNGNSPQTIVVTNGNLNAAFP